MSSAELESPCAREKRKSILKKLERTRRRRQAKSDHVHADRMFSLSDDGGSLPARQREMKKFVRRRRKLRFSGDRSRGDAKYAPEDGTKTQQIVVICDCAEYDLDGLMEKMQTQTIGSQTPPLIRLQTSHRKMSGDGSNDEQVEASLPLLPPAPTTPSRRMQRKQGYRSMSTTPGRLSNAQWHVARDSDVIHLRPKPSFGDSVRDDSGDFDVFVVSWGVVAVWNASPLRVAQARDLTRAYRVEPVSGAEREEMEYCKGLRAEVQNDVISLTSEKDADEARHEMIAATLALAQSVKLSVLETHINSQIERVKFLPKELARHGHIQSLSRQQVQKLLGELFITHTNLTLTSDLLDTPDFFWEEDTDLPFYRRLVGYLEIPKRTQTLNKRKDVLHELYDIIRDSKELQQTVRLEWIVIWLILVEVVLEVIQIVVGTYLRIENY